MPTPYDDIWRTWNRQVKHWEEPIFYLRHHRRHHQTSVINDLQWSIFTISLHHVQHQCSPLLANETHRRTISFPCLSCMFQAFSRVSSLSLREAPGSQVLSSKIDSLTVQGAAVIQTLRISSGWCRMIFHAIPCSNTWNVESIPGVKLQHPFNSLVRGFGGIRGFAHICPQHFLFTGCFEAGTFSSAVQQGKQKRIQPIFFFCFASLKDSASKTTGRTGQDTHAVYI